MITNQKEFFNTTYKNWILDISEEKINIALKSIYSLNIKNGDSILDVGAGTGILYFALRNINLKKYLALDISEKMIEELKKSFPNAEALCLDFDKEISLNHTFDYVIIFNSIPHFENLDIVFKNANKLLKKKGVFSIVHTRTRQGIKDYHKKIGYYMDRDAIPSNITLKQLSEKWGFDNIIIKNEEFFYFSSSKA